MDLGTDPGDSNDPGEESQEHWNLVAQSIADQNQTPGAKTMDGVDDLNENATNVDNPLDLKFTPPSWSPIFHCQKCRKTFASRFGCRAHVRKNACSKVSHCPGKHDHRWVELDVETMAIALEWFHSQELDRFFFKESSRPSLRIFRCSQRSRKSSSPIKKTKKIYDCSAKIVFRQATLCQCEDTITEICRNGKPMVLIYGCLTHSHPIDRKNIRLSKVTKNQALKLLQSGLEHGDIIEKYFAPNDDDPDRKPVIPADLYRIRRTAGLRGLENVDQVFIRKKLKGKERMRNMGYSKIQTDYSACHPGKEEMQKYLVEQKPGGFDIIRKGPDGEEVGRYRMMPNRFLCNKTLCQVRCLNCPPKCICAHDYTCQCPEYAHRNFCNHGHVLAMLSNASSPTSKHQPNDDQSQLDDSYRGSGRSKDNCSNIADHYPVQPVDQEFVKIQKRFRQIEGAFSSSDIKDDEKLMIVNSLLHVPINDVEIPLRFSNNANSFL
ncbi:uncharacterized protein LOC131886305 isoform X2 [Tigriopus californicus]|nr:uncharacterized protein LOC131886305 isoform X2 [Tigriopus californicus]